MAFRIITLQQIRWVNERHDMKNNFLLTRIARSMLIAGMVLGIVGAAYAQSGAGGGGGGAGVGSAAGGGAAVGQGSAGISAGTGANASSGSAGGAAAAERGSGGMSAGAAAAAGQAGRGMSGMSGALPGLGQESSMSEQAVPGLESSSEPLAGPASEPDIPPGEKRTSRASPSTKGFDGVGAESSGMGVGSSR